MWIWYWNCFSYCYVNTSMIVISLYNYNNNFHQLHSNWVDVLIIPFIIIQIWNLTSHDYVIKWKHFPCNWPFVRGIYRSPVNSPHKGQWRGVLMFSFIFVWINRWINNRKTGDLRRYRAHYDVTVMHFNSMDIPYFWSTSNQIRRQLESF